MRADRLPAFLIEFGRLGRTALLYAWGPVERLFRPRELRGAPPLWLRRHAGPVSKFSSSAREMRDLLSGLSLLPENARVLDAGCGAGAFAAELQGALGPSARYVGFDVHGPSIRWCRRRFAGDPRFRFEIARVRTPYSRRSRGRALEFRFPAPDAGCDLVLAKSLFTHLLQAQAEAYLREIRRVLAPGGRAVLTAFFFDPSRDTPAFSFSDDTGSTRFRVRRRPEAAVAYSRPVFDEMILAAGLRTERAIDGFYPGGSPIPSGQDIRILSAAADR